MSKLGNFVWGIADQLRGVYKPHQYGGVILPFTILRRLDCILESTRDEVRILAANYTGGALDVQVKRKTQLGFYNVSAFDFARLLEDPEGLRANLMDYITGFSANIDVFERFKFENELATLDEKNRLYLVTSKFAEIDLHPDTVPNAEMGDLFEHLIYKFAEASNEEAGEVPLDRCSWGNDAAPSHIKRRRIDESLITLYPELAAQWDPEKNGELTSADVTWVVRAAAGGRATNNGGRPYSQQSRTKAAASCPAAGLLVAPKIAAAVAPLSLTTAVIRVAGPSGRRKPLWYGVTRQPRGYPP